MGHYLAIQKAGLAGRFAPLISYLPSSGLVFKGWHSSSYLGGLKLGVTLERKHKDCKHWSP